MSQPVILAQLNYHRVLLLGPSLSILISAVNFMYISIGYRVIVGVNTILHVCSGFSHPALCILRTGNEKPRLHAVSLDSQVFTPAMTITDADICEVDCSLQLASAAMHARYM